MIGFGRKPRPSISREDALNARPLRAPGITHERTDDGGARLTIPLKSSARFGWLLRLPKDATKTFELDAIGLFVWEHCDGKTSVQQIIRKLSKQYNLGLRQAEVPTVQFLNMLSRKGLIGMSVQEKADNATTETRRHGGSTEERT
jgi:hypothetical protein